MRVGLTGGVGSGKSTVADLLGRRGAVIVDADQIAREVVRGGTPGFTAVVERFGPEIVGSDGELDRAALARLVFADEQARSDLNAIVHPLVGRRSHELLTAVPDDAVVVYDVPLLVEADRAGDFDVVVVVEAPLPERLARLEARGLPRDEAHARMAAQASDDQRRAVADVVIDNAGNLETLGLQVDALWQRLRGLESPSAIG